MSKAQSPTEPQWRSVVGYEGVYEVSNDGRVRRILPGKGARCGELSLLNHNSGYYLVKLCFENVRRSVLAHRLVAEAFHGSAPADRQHVNHKNGDKRDNRVANLEWVSRSQNVRHMLHTLQRARKLSDTDLEEIRKKYETGEYTQAELGDHYGVSQVQIGNVVRGDSWGSRTG